MRTPHLGGERRQGASTFTFRSPGGPRDQHAQHFPFSPLQDHRLTAIGVVATSLCIGGAGMVSAANPASAFGQAVGTAAHAAGVDRSDMPEGYTQAR